MAYETASASGVADLLAKIRTFALANGWTQDYSGVRGDGAGDALLIHRGALHFGIATTTGAGTTADPGPGFETWCYPGPYVAGNGVLTQANASGRCRTNGMAGSFQAYHFFASGNYLHIVVEVSPGSFRHLGIGQIEKAGAVTDGCYAHGTQWDFSTTYINSLASAQHSLPFDDAGGAQISGCTVIRADSDSLSPRYVRVQDTVAGGGYGGFRRTAASTRTASPHAGMLAVGPSALTGRAVMLPLFCGVHRPSGMLSLVGAPPDIRVMRIDNIQPGGLITLGPDTWKAFPIIRKNGALGMENSLGYGFAYRVIA